MSAPRIALDGRAAALRREFDQTFGEAPCAASVPTDDILSVRVSGRSYAMRLSELTGLAKAGRVVPMPSPEPALLGVAGLRGSAVPVFGLAALLGHAPAASPPRWLALSGDADRIALAFDELEGFSRLPRADFHEPRAGASGHVREAVRAAGATLLVIDVRSILAALDAAAGAAGPAKEH